MEHNYRQLSASLTPEQKAFMASKKLKGAYSPGRLMKLISKVSILDRLGDARMAKLRSIGGWVILFSILGLIAGIVIASQANERLIPFVIAIPVIAFILGILLRSQSGALRKNDLDNKVRKYALPVIAILREEARPGSKIRVELLGDNEMDKAYLKETIPRPGSLGPLVRSYNQPWFSGAIELCDRSELDFNICRDVQVIEIKKRNQRGTKIKYKTKYKVLDTITLQLTVSKSLYKPAIQEAKIPIKIVDKEDCYVLKFKHRIKSSKIEMPNYQNFLQQVQYLFANLKRVG